MGDWVGLGEGAGLGDPLFPVVLSVLSNYA